MVVVKKKKEKEKEKEVEKAIVEEEKEEKVEKSEDVLWGDDIETDSEDGEMELEDFGEE